MGEVKRYEQEPVETTGGGMLHIGEGILAHYEAEDLWVKASDYDALAARHARLVKAAQAALIHVMDIPTAMALRAALAEEDENG